MAYIPKATCDAKKLGDGRWMLEIDDTSVGPFTSDELRAIKEELDWLDEEGWGM